MGTFSKKAQAIVRAIEERLGADIDNNEENIDSLLEKHAEELKGLKQSDINILKKAMKETEKMEGQMMYPTTPTRHRKASKPDAGNIVNKKEIAKNNRGRATIQREERE